MFITLAISVEMQDCQVLIADDTECCHCRVDIRYGGAVIRNYMRSLQWRRQGQECVDLVPRIGGVEVFCGCYPALRLLC